MDSVSHIIIGAAIGEATLGKKIGRWGMLIGALAKTVPDFDLFYTGLKDAKLYMCHHRGHTHSLIWETLYAIPLAFIFYLLFRKKVTFKQMLLTWLICLYGHSILDWFTNYGTRLFLPFTNESYTINTISIVDLVFTVPMFVLSIWSIFSSNKSNRRLRLNQFVLAYCLLYLGAISVNKIYMNTVFGESLKKEGIPTSKFMTNPTILNNVLWYANAVNDSMLYTAEYSLFDKDKKLKWVGYKRNLDLLKKHPDQEDIAHLNWFSRGYSIAHQNKDTLEYYAVKFGRNSFKDSALRRSFVFHYRLYPHKNKWEFGFIEPSSTTANFNEAFMELWNRMLGKK